MPTPSDELVRTISEDGSVAVRALVGTGIAREGAERHATAPTASAALGRSLLGAVLLASGQADEETVQLQFRGDGPVGTVTAIAQGTGAVRGYVSEPGADPRTAGGNLDVAGAVGRGVLAVVRHRPGWREPYSGLVPIRSGEIATDLAHYLSESEQKPSAVALGLFLDADAQVGIAGGFLVQALPDADERVLAQVEARVQALPPTTELLRGGTDAEGLVAAVLGEVGHRALHRSTPRFACGCSRERVRRTLVLLGHEELRALRARGESVETHCRFCNERYEIGSDELAILLPDA